MIRQKENKEFLKVFLGSMHTALSEQKCNEFSLSVGAGG